VFDRVVTVQQTEVVVAEVAEMDAPEEQMLVV
jgi:hypothetical protein